jgi:hypothetical protein
MKQQRTAEHGRVRETWTDKRRLDHLWCDLGPIHCRQRHCDA